jgi:dihydroflavonol-4-reductase
VRVLVTGASGLIGAHVARELAESGADVRALCRSEPPPEARVAEHFAADLRDTAALERATQGCAAVIHVAALYSYARADARAMEAVNVAATRAVLAAAARGGGRRVVVTSSSATCGPVTGRPATEDDAPPDWELRIPYKRTKVDGERVALAAARSGHDVVVVNPTTTIGPFDRRPTPSGRMVLGVMRGQIRAYLPRAGINVVAAADVAHGHRLALERGRAGERYLLGGDNLSLRDAFALIAACAGRAAPRLPVPYPVALAAAHAADAAGRALGREFEVLNLDETRLARHPLHFSSAKAARELGYAWRSADEAISDAVAWFARLNQTGR